MNLSLPTKTQLLADIAEMNRIYSSLTSAMEKKNSVCLAVTSSWRGEGKTSLTAGLAIVAARQSGKKVLTIDFDWYHPALHHHFEAVSDLALVRFGTGSFQDQVHASGIENLDILPAEPLDKETDTGFHKSAVGFEILRKAREQYDIVIVDTASIFPTNRNMVDPVQIASVVDHVVMVVMINDRPRDQVKKASVILETANANIIGVVANHWRDPLA